MMRKQLLRRAGRGRLPTILAATGFNLLFEVSLRGLPTLAGRPLLAAALFAAYFTFYTMLEDLIVRYRLRDYNVAAAAFFFGTIYVALVSGAAFSPPRVAGLNWGAVLYINLVWWALLQSVFTFYVANRIAPRDWNHRLLSPLGWGALIAINLAVVRLFNTSPQVPRGDGPGFLAIGALLIGSAVVYNRLLARTRRASEPAAPGRHRLLDLLALITVGVFVVGAGINRNATIEAAGLDAPGARLVLGWTLVLAIILVAYRLVRRHSIPV